MLQDVGVFGIVKVDLVSDESLFCSMSARCSPKQYRTTYLMDGDTSTHCGQDAANVVCAEGLGVECTGEVPHPQIGYDLVHRHSVIAWIAENNGVGAQGQRKMESSIVAVVVVGSGGYEQAANMVGAHGSRTDIVELAYNQLPHPFLQRQLSPLHLIPPLTSPIVPYDKQCHERPNGATDGARRPPKGASVSVCYLFDTDIVDDIFNHELDRLVVLHASQPPSSEERRNSPNFSRNAPRSFGRTTRNRSALSPLSATRCWLLRRGRHPRHPRRTQWTDRNWKLSAPNDLYSFANAPIENERGYHGTRSAHSGTRSGHWFRWNLPIGMKRG